MNRKLLGTVGAVVVGIGLFALVLPVATSIIFQGGAVFPTPYTRPQMTIFDAMADIGILVSGAGLTFFVAWYGVMHKWWKKPVGVAIMCVFLSLFSIILLIFLSRLFGGDYPFRDVARFATYWFVGTSILALDVVMVRAWLRGVPPLFVPERESMRRTAEHPTVEPGGAATPTSEDE